MAIVRGGDTINRFVSSPAQVAADRNFGTLTVREDYWYINSLMRFWQVRQLNLAPVIFRRGFRERPASASQG